MIDPDEANGLSPNLKSKRSLNIMSLSRFEPLVNFRVFEDAVNRMLTEPQTNRPWSPAVDIYETENELVLKADLPEVDSKDVDVRVENQTLTISGERKFESEKSEKGFHRIERSYGNFTRSFTVPNTFDTSNVAASFKNGVLAIKLPKKEAAKPRQIKIEATN
jgi:HSP20 family protein